MAIQFGKDRTVDFAAGNLMTFAKSFSAMNGQPLDNREVWYDKTALETAAKGTTMYVGQKVTFVDVANNKVYQYSVQLDGTLKEIGVAPIGDGATIAVDAETGKVALFGVDGLDANKTYVPSFVGGKLTWAEPDTSTAEGQQQAIDGLTSRMQNVEGDVDALEEAVGNAEGGLVKDVADNKAAIEAEASARDTAVKAVDEKANKNASDITNLAARVSVTEGNFASYYTKTEADTKIAEEIGKQAHFSAKVVTSEDDMTDATTLYLVKVDDAEGADVYNQYIVIDGVPTLIGDTTTDLSDYATTTDVQSLIASAISASEEKTAGDIEVVDGKVDTVASDLADFETEVGNTYATKTALADANTAIEGLGARMTAAETAATSLTERVAANEGSIEDLQEVDEGFETRIAGLEALNAERNVIAAVSGEFNVAEDTRTLSIASIAQDKIIGLSDSLASKVNAVTSEYNGEQVAWTLVSPENQEKLKALVIGESGVEISGTVNADNVEGLGAFITENRNTLGGLYPEADASKLLTVETGAQANIIETIKIGGVAASTTDKVVEVPFAAMNTAGVVKSTAAENGVAVAADGTMSVNSINVNKLVQTEGDELIISGGNATV